tara:strand:- start:1715 stop:2263 length:549 start_codon:yes stop_codon:yes gene_type:complete
MIDLNGSDFAEKVVKVFNNGVGGKVENVTIKVEKKPLDGHEQAPDFNVVFTDSEGASANSGFYYNGNEQILISRALHVGRAVLGAEYVFPAAESTKDALNKIMKLIKDNSEGKLFNTFCTYGNANYKPSQYLNIRFFDFIEPADVENTRLRVKNGDLLEKVAEDTPSTKAGSGDAVAADDWV